MDSEVGGETCSICHDDMQKAAALPCGHCFHRPFQDEMVAFSFQDEGTPSEGHENKLGGSKKQ